MSGESLAGRIMRKQYRGPEHDLLPPASPVPTVCPTCKGTGNFAIGTTGTNLKVVDCPSCRGSGHVDGSEERNEG